MAIFIGRLMPEKKLHLLIDAFFEFHSADNPINLLFVGSGPAADSLRERVPNSLQHHVNFFGPCYCEDSLASMIHAASVCVSPGSVGLTAMHSLVYGTPVVTHNDGRRQNPEYEAIRDGETGSLFKQDDPDSLFAAMKEWLFASKDKRHSTRNKCQQIIDQHYTPANQRRIIEQALDGRQASSISRFAESENQKWAS